MGLPYSRKKELEADYIGYEYRFYGGHQSLYKRILIYIWIFSMVQRLLLMAKACYDIQQPALVGSQF